MFYKTMDTIQGAFAELELPNGLNSEDAAAMYFGCQYTVNLLEDHGLEWRGYTYKVRLPLGLLVVKASIDDAPVVAFVSGRTLTDCFRIFFRQLAERFVQWVPDKFA